MVSYNCVRASPNGPPLDWAQRVALPVDGRDDPDADIDPAWTLTELRMQRLSYTLRSRPSWWAKYKDPGIRREWKTEALSQQILGHTLTEAEVEYVLDELAGYDKMRNRETGIQQSCFRQVYESDHLIPQNLGDKLKDTAAELRDDARWHLQSNNEVVHNLLDPSLHCLAYKQTCRIVSEDTKGGVDESNDDEDAPDDDEDDEMGDGDDVDHDRNHGHEQDNEQAAEHWGPDSSTGAALELVQAPELRPKLWAYSAKYAWIPTDFKIPENGAPAKACSYINNAHPSRKEFVTTVEAVVGQFALIFRDVLTDLFADGWPWYRRVKGGVKYPDDTPDDQAGEAEADYESRLKAWRETQNFSLPTISDKYSKHVWMRRTICKFLGRGQTVQIIVKLSHYCLTPESPTYGGGPWHIEGMANERIVACGVYIYDSENVEENGLAFRTAVKSANSEPDDYFGARHAYGLDRSTPSNQHLGSVKAVTGRCIAFPNTYQHRMLPFSLIDKTRSGHRKVLELFLVDPTVKIPSTTNIPFQQGHWILQAMEPDNERSPFSKLPQEIRDMIVQDTGAMIPTEARRFRDEMEGERTEFVTTQNEKFFEVPFEV